MHISIIILNISCFFRKFNKKRLRIYIIPNKKLRTFVTFFLYATTILFSLTSFMQLEFLTPGKICFLILIADIIYIYLLFSIKSIFFSTNSQLHLYSYTQNGLNNYFLHRSNCYFFKTHNFFNKTSQPLHDIGWKLKFVFKK